jgi:membrane-bound lytic murein transglycosylase B
MNIRQRIYILAVLILSLMAFFAPLHAQVLTPEQKAQLERELAQVEADQKQAEKDLASAQGQSSSLQKDISVLSAKIKVAQLNIKAKNLLIESLGKDIKNKEVYIGKLEDRIDRGRDTLAQIMRKTNEAGTYTLPEMLLSQTTLTGFFTDLDSFQSVQEGLKTTFERIRSDKSETEAEKSTLDKRKNAETDARYIIQQEEKSIKANEAEKQRLLAASKGNEKAYSAVLAEKRARASQIRAALFQLRDSNPIPFGDALKYAQAAAAKTGVRPAFVLAILTQESALGANVGACYLTNTQTGEGISKKTGSYVAKVMKPGRDVEPFIDIVKKLGGDPMKQVVSCPQSVGWGGAMGPAQFIASTWVLFEDRIAANLGISGIPDPWNPSHAFMASSIYLGDLGASGGTYSSERNAACKYYSGKSCSASSLIASYGNSVIAKADNIQRTMIDPLQGL